MIASLSKQGAYMIKITKLTNQVKPTKCFYLELSIPGYQLSKFEHTVLLCKLPFYLVHSLTCGQGDIVKILKAKCNTLEN